MAKLASSTTFKWDDRSKILDPAVAAGVNKPVILIASTADKGPEDLRLVSTDFHKLYLFNKKTAYARHGQPLLQSAALVDNGATLLFKRIVAEDATLANAIVSVKVTKTPDPTPVPPGPDPNPGGGGGGAQQPTDPDAGQQGGGGTVGPDGQPITRAKVDPKLTIKWQIDTVQDAKSIADVKVAAARLAKLDDDDEKVFPLFVITDVGRGTSNKKFRLIPDYTTYRDLTFMRYTFQIIEETTILENLYFSPDQDVQYGGNNYSLDSVVKKNSKQISAFTFASHLESFIEFVANILTVDKSTIYNSDIFFGCNRNGIQNPDIAIDADSINLNNTLGINLLHGGNGSFGNNPMADTDAYTKALVDVFNGTVTDDIFDVDKYQIDAVFDANYPEEVKREIEILADYREDFFYFRDLGFVYTYDQIRTKSLMATPSKFSASYHNSYEVIDPYSKKQIPVTVTYTLSKLFIKHFLNGKANPFEGILHGITLDEAIEGTVNYVPRKLPNADQKQALVDIGVNFASYYGSTLVIESQWTSQLEHTQLSWINNVIAIQEIIKDLRVYCPRTRYTFIDEDGYGDTSAFDNYKKDIEERLQGYSANFASLGFEYVQDETQVQNKVFSGAIYFKFRNFVESEFFTLFALGSDTTE